MTTIELFIEAPSTARATAQPPGDNPPRHRDAEARKSLQLQWFPTLGGRAKQGPP